MRILTHRLIGLVLLAAVLGVVGAPIASFDALGQENVEPEPTIAAETEAAIPTAPSVPAVIPSEAPPVEAQPTEPPPVDQLAPTEIVIEPATEAAPLTAVENSPSPTDVPAPSDTATSAPASATATDIPVQAAAIPIVADLSPAVCGNSWRFVITGLTATTAPSTIAVVFANAGPIQIPLFFNETSGVAFYNRSSGLDDTVLSATATVPDDFSGTFVLDTKGCAISTATPTQTPVPQVITADLSPAACGNSWRFSITGLTATMAPPFIAVIFANSAPVQIPLFFNETSGVAFYNRSSGLDDTVISASATVPGDFSGVFQLDTKGCPAEATATGTPTSQLINADMTTGGCGSVWSFQITGIEPPVNAPESITVFEGGADFSMDLQQPQTGTVAIYSRADLNDLDLDSAKARISSAWNGTFTLLTFPCADFTPSPTATGTPASQFINADPDGTVCGTSWRFEITGIVPPVVAPNSITLLTSSGDFTVDQTSIVGTTTFYERGDLPPDFTFVSATARISSSWSGEFNLLTFPCVDTPTPTSTPTNTPISPSATSTDTATNTPITPSATPTDTPTSTAVAPSSTPTDTPTSTPTGSVEVEIFADLNDCEASSISWLFRLSNTVDGGQNPLSITATFDTVSVSIPRIATLVEGSTFVGLYNWDENLGDTLLSASAVVPGNVTFVFRLAQGPSCALAPSVTATNTANATSTATASQTAIGAPTWTPTASATHRPHIWASHTPPASRTPVPPIGGLPITGTGSGGSSMGVWIVLAIIGALATLGFALRRRHIA